MLKWLFQVCASADPTANHDASSNAAVRDIFLRAKGLNLFWSITVLSMRTAEIVKQVTLVLTAMACSRKVDSNLIFVTFMDNQFAYFYNRKYQH